MTEAGLRRSSDETAAGIRTLEGTEDEHGK
jgi:hypothetical protein